MPTWGTVAELAEVVALAAAGAIHSEAEVFGIDQVLSAYGRLRNGTCSDARSSSRAAVN